MIGRPTSIQNVPCTAFRKNLPCFLGPVRKKLSNWNILWLGRFKIYDARRLFAIYYVSHRMSFANSLENHRIALNTRTERQGYSYWISVFNCRFLFLHLKLVRLQIGRQMFFTPKKGIYGAMQKILSLYNKK